MTEARRRTGLTVRPMEMLHLDAAARLLADRHRAQRVAEPDLSPAFEAPAAARLAIEALLRAEGASGAVALDRDEVVGYLVGAPRAALWGPNIWVEGAGHAARHPEIVRDLYGVAAERWVAEGATSHYAIVPASEAGLVEAWFGLGFGQQHVHGIREPAAPGEAPTVPPGLRVRRAERDDIPALGRIDLVLTEHQARSPVFSRQPPDVLEERIADWEVSFDDPTYTTFVALIGETVVGSATGCPIDVSSEHRGIVQPPGAGFLGFAAVLPEARGLGAGRALGEAILAWARDAGHPSVVTDWRQTNLLSSRTWPRLGFRPLFRRLHRAIA